MTALCNPPNPLHAALLAFLMENLQDPSRWPTAGFLSVPLLLFEINLSKHKQAAPRGQHYYNNLCVTCAVSQDVLFFFFFFCFCLQAILLWHPSGREVMWTSSAVMTNYPSSRRSRRISQPRVVNLNKYSGLDWRVRSSDGKVSVSVVFI